MLINFSVGNYLSFKDVINFDMNAEALKEKKSYIHVPHQYSSKVKALKSAVIYGHNSFGKTNILKAYASYRNLILTSFFFGNKHEEKVDIVPFQLNTATREKPTFFESVFIIKGTKYRYGFEFFDQKVISEWLFYAEGGVRENPMFVRLDLEFRELNKTWNKQSKNRVEQSKIFTKSPNLFLSVLLSQENIPRIDDIGVWFKSNIIITGGYSLSINNGAAQIYTNEKYRSVILKFLENADLGFTSIIERVSAISDRYSYDADLLDYLFDVEKNNFDLYTNHKLFNDNNDFVKPISFNLQKDESTGSIKYFIVSCFLAYAIKKGQLIWIDELDASLSTQLILFLLETFNHEKNNITGAQLIFTAHNTVLLDNQLRRDQIWFVDKNERGESSLHKGHSPQNPIRINKSIEQEYRKGTIKKGTSKKATKNNLPSLFGDIED